MLLIMTHLLQSSTRFVIDDLSEDSLVHVYAYSAEMCPPLSSVSN
jgi:hypothetical protein